LHPFVIHEIFITIQTRINPWSTLVKVLTNRLLDLENLQNFD
jgi:hypothetical protein